MKGGALVPCKSTKRIGDDRESGRPCQTGGMRVKAGYTARRRGWARDGGPDQEPDQEGAADEATWQAADFSEGDGSMFGKTSTAG